MSYGDITRRMHENIQLFEDYIYVYYTMSQSGLALIKYSKSV